MPSGEESTSHHGLLSCPNSGQPQSRPSQLPNFLWDQPRPVCCLHHSLHSPMCTALRSNTQPCTVTPRAVGDGRPQSGVWSGVTCQPAGNAEASAATGAAWRPADCGMWGCSAVHLVKWGGTLQKEHTTCQTPLETRGHTSGMRTMESGAVGGKIKAMV